MASITITVPNAMVPRITTAMRDAFPQHSALTDVEAFKAITADYWKRVLAVYEIQEAGIQAQDAARQKAIDDSVGIV